MAMPPAEDQDLTFAGMERQVFGGNNVNYHKKHNETDEDTEVPVSHS